MDQPYSRLTGLLAAWLTLGGWLDIAGAHQMREIMRTLHYPDYLLPILGPCKLLAVLALLYPKTRFLREWAYAGITIDALGAFASHCAVHDDLSRAAAPLLMLAIAAGSYFLRPDKLRLTGDRTPSLRH
jgi:hypothetical protein